MFVYIKFRWGRSSPNVYRIQLCRFGLLALFFSQLGAIGVFKMGHVAGTCFPYILICYDIYVYVLLRLPDCYIELIRCWVEIPVYILSQLTHVHTFNTFTYYFPKLSGNIQYLLYQI